MNKDKQNEKTAKAIVNKTTKRKQNCKRKNKQHQTKWRTANT